MIKSFGNWICLELEFLTFKILALEGSYNLALPYLLTLTHRGKKAQIKTKKSLVCLWTISLRQKSEKSRIKRGLKFILFIYLLFLLYIFSF
jgi:hypothetical protein